MKIKKPKFWDLKKPNIISLLLLPFTLPIIINNYLLNSKKQIKNNKIKTICIGNIYLGGTGKTPTALSVYSILDRLKFNVVVGKKFYKLQSDENILLKKKAKLINGDSRKDIINQAIQSQQNIVVFDDGLQDKTISYDLQFVCFDETTFIGNGCLIPSGPLREKPYSLRKFDGVFLKCENDINSKQFEFFKKYNSSIKIFETQFEISNLKEFDLSKNYLIVSGVGNPKSFENTLIRNQFKIKDHIIFPDHYQYKKNDIEKIIKQAEQIDAKLVTTEKDFAKISKFDSNIIKSVNVKLIIKNENDLINFLKLRLS